MKSIAYIMVFLMVLFIVEGNGFDVYRAELGNIIPINACSTVRFCSDDNYNLECNYFMDNICPEDYGDWSHCGSNNDGSKCWPCDLDCDDSCQVVQLDVPNVQYPGETIEIKADAYVEEIEADNIFTLSKILGLPDLEIELSDDADCVAVQGGYKCSSIFSIDLEDLDLIPCESYTFHVEFEQGEAVTGEASDSGMVSPYVIITSPQQNEEISGFIQVTSNTICEGRRVDEEPQIESISYLISKEQEGGFTTPALFGSLIILNPNSQELNTWNYYNGNYRISVLAVGENGGLREPYAENVDVAIVNEGEPQEYGGSSILNLILARIRTWL